MFFKQLHDGLMCSVSNFTKYIDRMRHGAELKNSSRPSRVPLPDAGHQVAQLQPAAERQLLPAGQELVQLLVLAAPLLERVQRHALPAAEARQARRVPRLAQLGTRTPSRTAFTYNCWL